MEQKTNRGIRSFWDGATAWTLKVGTPCSFYHEGGSGERYWARGWRYGFVVALPSKGKKKGWAQVEVRVNLLGWNDGSLKDKPRGWFVRPLERAWVHSSNVNEPGDFIYHGLKLDEMVKERREEKAEQQTKADKKKAKGRFVRAA